MTTAFTRLLLVGLASIALPLYAELTPEQIKALPTAQIEKQLPDEHPTSYYLYAGRLFNEGRKDDAVFWFYVGQLRYRIHLKAHPDLPPSGDPAVFSSLSATMGRKINEYAGGSIKGWTGAIDRALKWDAATPNGFTSKKKYAAAHQEIRAGLKAMRDEVESTASSIRASRKKAGLEVRD